MANYTGSSYNFKIQETQVYANLSIVCSFNSLPANIIIVDIQYRVVGSTTWLTATGTNYTSTSPITRTIPYNSNYEYQVILTDNTYISTTVSFTKDVVVPGVIQNYIYIPELNPVIFFEKNKTNLPKYQYKQFEDFAFAQRSYYWQEPADYCQIWQTTDIIYLQFESSFDPIIVSLLNSDGVSVITLPALVGLPNKFLPYAYSFEIGMSLAGLTTGIYNLQIEAGIGANKKIFVSGFNQYISSEILENTLMLEYHNSRFHNDVVFETGIVFQKRIPGFIGFLDPARTDDKYKDQRFNPALLNSRVSKQWPVHFGDEFGLPDDEINTLHQIWSCNNVTIDQKAFGLSGNFEYVAVDKYQKRGVKVLVEAGINRNSRIFAVNTDTTKKLITTAIVQAKVFGDTANQGSSNTVPVYQISQL
jgi:hypothetical protein